MTSSPEVLDVSPIHLSAQLINVSVTIIDKQTSFLASFVYGFNNLGTRLTLWDDIKHLSSQRPWILLGDFNVVRYQQERLGGDLSWPPYMTNLNDCCYDAQVDDLKASGIHLTWVKRGNDGDRKSRKLDRVLCNTKWLSCFPLSEAEFLPPSSSTTVPCWFEQELRCIGGELHFASSKCGLITKSLRT